LDNKIKSSKPLIDGKNFIFSDALKKRSNNLKEQFMNEEKLASGKEPTNFQKYCNSLNASNLFMKITNMMKKKDSSSLKRNDFENYLHAPLSFDRAGGRHKSFKRRRKSRSCNQAEIKIDENLLNKTHTDLISRNLDKHVISPNVKSEERESNGRANKKSIFSFNKICESNCHL
jgi:hypothetical protein